MGRNPKCFCLIYLEMSSGNVIFIKNTTMNKYEIFVIAGDNVKSFGDNVKSFKVIAEDFEIDNGFYRFWYNDKTIACYPINFTIIKSIEKILEEIK